MKFKIVISSIVIFGLIATGCKSSNINSKEIIADDVTKQRTITKVQNDVNEILDKDYDYILKNMGRPLYSTYYIDSEDINDINIDKLNQLEKKSNMVLVYPKDDNNNEIDKSALYIELKDNKVIDVQTYKLSEYDMEIDTAPEYADLIIDKYNDKVILSESSIEKKEFSNYIGKNQAEIFKLIGEELPNFDAFNKDSTKEVMGYFLEGKDGNVKNVLTVYIEESKIKSIDMLDKSKVINFVKDNLNK